MVTISAALKHTYEFACYSAACAPPSAGGTGGSIGKGGGKRTMSLETSVTGRPGTARRTPRAVGGASKRSVSLEDSVTGRPGVPIRAKGGPSQAASKGGGGGGGTPTEIMPTWAKRAGLPDHATVKGNVATIKNQDGSVTKITHAKNSKGLHKFDTKTTKEGYEIHDDSSGYGKGYGGAQSAARSAARHASSDKSKAVKSYEKDYGVRRKDADPNSMQAKYKGRQAGVRFPKDLQTNAAGDIIIRSGGGYNPNAGAKLGTMSRQESGKGWQGTLEDGHVVKSKTRAGVLAATVRYIQK